MNYEELAAVSRAIAATRCCGPDGCRHAGDCDARVAEYFNEAAAAIDAIEKIRKMGEQRRATAMEQVRGVIAADVSRETEGG